jgi:hypothetical protein
MPNRTDPTWDRLMGAFAVLARAGNNAEKAGSIYRRHAMLACGYPELDLISDNPVIIDIAGAVFTVRPDRLELVGGGMFDRDGGHA